VSRRGSGLWPWLGSDAGSGTVLGLVVLAMVCFVAAVSVARAQQVLAIRQASIAADLAALAGAQGMDDPCGRAGSVAAANGVRMSGCSVAGVDVLVEVISPMPPFTASLLRSFGLPVPPISAHSRAGYQDGV